MTDYSDFFTHRKPTATGSRALRWWHQRMLVIAKRHIPHFAQKTLLEIGAGHGFIADLCQSQGITYLGHEMNVAQAAHLQAEGHAVTAATIPPIPAGKPTQVIWLSHVLEHAVDFREAKNMLRACYERLDTDGYIVIIAPDVTHWHAHFWTVDWSHGFPTSSNRVEQLLHETGFSVHRNLHHAFTVTNPLIAWLISCTLRLLVPMQLIDYFLYKLIGRRYTYSFMSVFGWRQIYLIGKK